MKETIYDVFWEGPFEWEKRQSHLKRRHVLYSIAGSHPVYGRDVLLYIGRTDAGIGNRLSYHEEWVRYESDLVKVRVASVGEFTDWEEWEKNHLHYPKADANIVGKIEALLIYGHQLAYNTRGKSSLGAKIRIRIFNTGKSGLLLPELSYLYYAD
jgi:hypothetical protein